MVHYTADIGAYPVPGGIGFRVWAPAIESVEVELVESVELRMPLNRDGEYFHAVLPAVAGNRYWFWLNGSLRRPDPASRCQPDGVHGPSQVVDPEFAWGDSQWRGLALEEFIIYEIHVGTFTPEGTFDAAINRIDYLIELGVTTVELMPIAHFPGNRNWGYDGVFPFAPHMSYGGCDGLKRFVDACHQHGLAVLLDVVYNHLGPEGNYLHAFGPYFTNRYRTPWGDAVNFDGPFSDGVRHFFIHNACHWISEYHLDGLRLDAVHGIYDFSARHILQELAEAVHRQGAESGRLVHVIAESDLNDVRVIKSPQSDGYGLDAQWCDDFHHALRTLLTGDRTGYFQDFGRFPDLVKAFREGFVISGGYSASRKRCHGSSSAKIPPGQLVVYSQNHDQVGNRMRGERLSEHLSVAQLKLAAASVLLSPYIPLLFMGEEYAESAPFPYFVSHGDAKLIESVRRGRLEEFAEFTQEETPPDPQSETTFHSARLNINLRHQGDHRVVFDFYRELIRLRNENGPFVLHGREHLQIVACEEDHTLVVSRSFDNFQLTCLFNFSNQTRVINPELVGGSMTMLLDSTERLSPGGNVTVYFTRPETFLKLPPFAVLVFRKEK